MSAENKLTVEKLNKMFATQGYRIDDMIGEGGFGLVFGGIKIERRVDPDGNIRVERFPVAVKTINTRKLSYEMKCIFIPREIKALNEIKHRFVVKVYNVIESIQYQPYIFIFMELCPNGDLEQRMQNCGLFAELDAARWFGQSTEAFHYIHEEKHIAHRDIKLNNILLDIDLNAKVADFGICTETFQNTDYETRAKTFIGTPIYMPPEIIQEKPYDPFKADVFSLGVMLFSMLEGGYLLSECDKRNLFLHKMYPSYLYSKFRRSPNSARFLIQEMVNPKAELRYTMKQVLKSEYVTTMYFANKKPKTEEDTRPVSPSGFDCEENQSNFDDNEVNTQIHNPQIEPEEAPSVPAVNKGTVNRLRNFFETKAAEAAAAADEQARKQSGGKSAAAPSYQIARTPKFFERKRQDDDDEVIINLRKLFENSSSSSSSAAKRAKLPPKLPPITKFEKDVSRMYDNLGTLFLHYYDILNCRKESIAKLFKVLLQRKTKLQMIAGDLVNMHNIQEDRNIELYFGLEELKNKLQT